VDLREIAPGKLFHAVTRPIGVTDTLPFRVAFECVDLVEARDGATHQSGPHHHWHYEVIVVQGGTYECRINGAFVSLGPGGVAISKPGDLHEDLCRGAVRFAAVRFQVLPGPQPDRSANVLVDEPGLAGQVLSGTGAVFTDLVERLGAEGARTDPFTAHLLDSVMVTFVWALVRAVPREAVNPRLLVGAEDNELAAALHRLFEDHLGGQLGLREMAAELGLSERTLTARCRATFSDSPTRLFVRHKMQRARTLLVQTDLAIKEISAYLGFENPYHFSTVYKRVFGVAPTRARS